MKLPNGDRAVVDISKLTDYCLSFDHRRGQHKARVFLSALGLTRSDAELLRTALLRAAGSEDVVTESEGSYGSLYVLDFVMESRLASATIRSIWIIRTDEAFPRLVTCYVS